MVRAIPQGESGGVVLVMHDVTELRRLETVRRGFVANVSHELRAPVSVIQANTETLLSGALDEPAQARRFLGVMVVEDTMAMITSPSSVSPGCPAHTPHIAMVLGRNLVASAVVSSAALVSV
jgi:hypothetical protein